jgi:uncharacterized protein (DUF1330 family)
MPKGYVIGSASVSNASQWATYAASASEAIKKYGGRPLARGGTMTVGEGEGRARNVIIEFDSFEQAKAYLFSAEYAEARKLREGAGVISLVAVEGV